MSTNGKKARSIRLTPDMDNRLVELCDHLGTNPNAYLVNEIGKAISRDELAFRVQKSQEDALSQMMKLLNQGGDLEG